MGQAALLLAITKTREDEENIRTVLNGKGFKCAVTETGGSVQEVRKKVIKSVLGAALNNGVIEKNSREAHAILHATQEAERGYMFDSFWSNDVMMKISIVRTTNWIAVGMFGQSAMHMETNHERAGLGVMHI